MKRKEICNAAFELFALKGYDGCSLQEIADKVGLNKATLYNYFNSKEELFLTVLEKEISVYSIAVQEAVDNHIDESLETVLFEIVKAYMAHSDNYRLLLWKKTLLTAASAVDDSVRELSRAVMYGENVQIIDVVKQLFAAKNVDYNSPKVKLFMKSYYIFLQSVLEWILLDDFKNNKDSSTTIKDLWDNFWNGSKIG